MAAGRWPVAIMLYGAGDAINGAGALETQIEAQLARLAQVATNYYVAALAQLDSSNVPPVRYVLDPLGRQPVTEILGFNAGDPEQLVNFAQWSMETCPADRTVLVLSGHGAAWKDDFAREVVGTRALSDWYRPLVDLAKGWLTRGIDPPHSNVLPRMVRPPLGGLSPRPSLLGGISSTSKPSIRENALHHPRALFGARVTPADTVVRALLVDGSDHDFLSNAELGLACQRVAALFGGVIDVLVFDACLMSSWEVLHEISAQVATVVASIDELSAAGVDLAVPASVMAANQGEMTAQDLAATIAGQFQPKASFDSCVAIDLASAQWAAAIASLRAFSDAVIPWTQISAANVMALKDALRLASTSIVKFWSGGLADVSALSQAIGGIRTLPNGCLKSMRDAESALRACVISKSVGSDYTTALGISLWAPNSQSDYDKNRADYVRLQFSSATRWGDVLDGLFNI